MQEQAPHRDALFAFLATMIMLTALLNQTALGVIADARNVSEARGTSSPTRGTNGGTPAPAVPRRAEAAARLLALHDAQAAQAAQAARTLRVSAEGNGLRGAF